MSQAAIRSDLREQGLSQSQISRALMTGRLVSSHRGVLTPAAGLDLETRCRSAALTQRSDAAIWLRSAAVLLALPGLPDAWSDPAAPIDIAVARDDTTRSARRGMRRRYCALTEDEIVCRHDIRLTTVARTLVDIAREDDRLLAVQLSDAALRAGLTTQADLATVLCRLTGLRGVTRARDVMARVRDGVDSPGETRARLAIVDAGLPEPMVRVEIRDDERLLARGDLGYKASLIWIEYDGFGAHSGQAVFRSDRHRDRWLERRGWQCIRLSDLDVARPIRFVPQLACMLRDAPARIAALPPGRSPEADAARAALAGGLRAG
jgi:hypothetical protein